MNTSELMESANNLTMSMALREGPRHADDQLQIAQVLALLAIANELKRMNEGGPIDRLEAVEERVGNLESKIDEVERQMAYGLGLE